MTRNNVVKAVALVAILVCSACTTTKEVQAIEQTKPSYRLPAIHMEVHKRMLEDQQKRIIHSDHERD